MCRELGPVLAATMLAGKDKVDRAPRPVMGSEDFAFLLQVKPGAYIWMGNGPDANDRRLHSPHYDFNDDALPVGASYWARLVELTLPRAG